MSLLHHIALSLLPGIGNVNAKALIGYCGGAAAVFQSTKKDLLKIPGIGPKLVEEIANSAPVLSAAERELRFLEKNGLHALSFLDKAYPQRLLPYPDCPQVLYFRGDTIDWLNHHRTVGIVGTRTPTPEGRAICEDLVRDLKPYGVLVVSGLAYGIDVAAHRQCVKEQIPTIAVVAHGLDSVYPPEHKDTARELCQLGGMLGEHPSGRLAKREHFPMRNRIIAALSDALVVVETAQRGGSIITANLANDYNKDVFAVPGRVRDTYSRGCNQLIRDHKAGLIESAKDVADFMRWAELDRQRPAQAQLFVDLSADEQQIVALLREHGQLAVDELSFFAQKTPSLMAALLLELEFKGLLRSLPGKRYMLL